MALLFFFAGNLVIVLQGYFDAPFGDLQIKSHDRVCIAAQYCITFFKELKYSVYNGKCLLLELREAWWVTVPWMDVHFVNGRMLDQGSFVWAEHFFFFGSQGNLCSWSVHGHITLDANQSTFCGVGVAETSCRKMQMDQSKSKIALLLLPLSWTKWNFLYWCFSKAEKTLFCLIIFTIGSKS